MLTSYKDYSYGDKNTMDRMIEQGSKDGRQQLSYEEQQRQKDDLRQVVQVSPNCLVAHLPA